METNDLVLVRDGAVRANSRDVAAKFGKRHDHVLRDISNILKDYEGVGCAPNFGETSVEVAMPNGGTRLSYSYDMDRDGFTLLAMGFTGKAALRWKIRYIAAFNAMEAELRKPQMPTLDLEDPATLRQLLLAQVERTLALQSALEGAGRAPVSYSPPPRREPHDIVLSWIQRFGRISRADLTHRMHGAIRPIETDRAVTLLAARGVISIVVEACPGGGRPRTEYRMTRH